MGTVANKLLVRIGKRLRSMDKFDQYGTANID